MTSRDVAAQPRAISINGVRAVLWTDADGVERAARDVCPHRRAPLSAGTVEEGRLRCAYHGWTYDGAGQCTLLPAAGAEGRIPERAHLQMLPVPPAPKPASPIETQPIEHAPSSDWVDGDTPGLDNFWHPVARSRELADLDTVEADLLGDRWVLERDGDGWQATSRRGARAWGVRHHLGHMWVAPREPMAPLPVVPEWDEPGWHHREMSRAEGRFGAGLLLDNQVDAAHFAFVHAATFGTPSAAVVPRSEIDSTATSVTSVMRVPISATNDHRPASDRGVRQDHRTMHYQYEAPLWLRLRLNYEMMGGSTVILFALTPQAAGRARMDVDLLFSHPDGFTPDALDRRVAFEEQVVGEDLALQRRFEDLRLPLEPTVELHTKADRLSLQCRQVLRGLLAQARQSAPG